MRARRFAGAFRVADSRYPTMFEMVPVPRMSPPLSQPPHLSAIEETELTCISGCINDQGYCPANGLNPPGGSAGDTPDFWTGLNTRQATRGTNHVDGLDRSKDAKRRRRDRPSDEEKDFHELCCAATSCVLGPLHPRQESKLLTLPSFLILESFIRSPTEVFPVDYEAEPASSLLFSRSVCQVFYFLFPCFARPTASLSVPYVTQHQQRRLHLSTFSPAAVRHILFGRLFRPLHALFVIPLDFLSTHHLYV